MIPADPDSGLPEYCDVMGSPRKPLALMSACRPIGTGKCILAATVVSRAISDSTFRRGLAGITQLFPRIRDIKPLAI